MGPLLRVNRGVKYNDRLITQNLDLIERLRRWEVNKKTHTHACIRAVVL